MASIWTPAVFNQPGQPPTRGLGGRIYFYDAGNRPIAVEGQLVVYAYNDTTPGAATAKRPTAKYAFTPEQFTEHYSPTDLGAAYSVWIPWDHVGQPEAEIGLVPVFTAASGQLVMGQSSKNLLPGPKPTTGVSTQPIPRPPLTLERLLQSNAAPPQSAVQQANSKHRRRTAPAQPRRASTPSRSNCPAAWRSAWPKLRRQKVCHSNGLSSGQRRCRRHWLLKLLPPNRPPLRRSRGAGGSVSRRGFR